MAIEYDFNSKSGYTIYQYIYIYHVRVFYFERNYSFVTTSYDLLYNYHRHNIVFKKLFIPKRMDILKFGDLLEILGVWQRKSQCFIIEK